MTTIAGAQHKTGCVIAADSQTTWGERPFNSFGVDKVIEKNGYLFAIAGDGRAADILNHAWKPPKITATGDLYGFMVAKVVPSIRKALADGGWKDSSDNKDDSGIDALIAIRGQLFSIASDFTVLRDEQGFYGAGSGGNYAVGALEAGADIRTAVEIAMKYDINSGGVVQVVTQLARR
jgi:ATP-dependent protease HslVU (ClpYQ) peptidase subunit